MNKKLTKEQILIPLFSALLIVAVGKLKIDFYFKTIMFPFLLIVIASTMLVIKDKDINKKAYFMLIPIMLIIFSNLVLLLLNGSLDGTNEFLNIFILPVIISIYLLMLTNKNYKIAFNNITLGFNLFPKNLFKNLIYLKKDIATKKSKKIINVILGIAIGIMISVIIVFLLASADDYFDSFLTKIAFNININFDTGLIIKFIFFFITLFSLGINLIKCRDIKMRENKLINIDNTIIITALSIINFVFVLFLISEISKVCGNFLRLPTGYIYSSYAREGFFELLTVTLINFSIILYLLYKTNVINENKIIKILVLLLITFSILLLFNSYYRMYLYIAKFGFTILRLQVILFLLMELILFGVIIKKIISEVKNDGLIFMMIMIITYIINLYICNDWFINLLLK